MNKSIARISYALDAEDSKIYLESFDNLEIQLFFGLQELVADGTIVVNKTNFDRVYMIELKDLGKSNFQNISSLLIQWLMTSQETDLDLIKFGRCCWLEQRNWFPLTEENCCVKTKKVKSLNF